MLQKKNLNSVQNKIIFGFINWVDNVNWPP